MIPVFIKDAHGHIVGVTQSGELKVFNTPFQTSKFVELGVDDQAYNFFAPIVGKQFVLTAFLAFADKQVSSTNNANVTIYEADAPDSATEKKIIFKFQAGQNSLTTLNGLRILSSKGVYINAKTSDDDVQMTLVGYFTDITDEVS